MLGRVQHVEGWGGDQGESGQVNVDLTVAGGGLCPARAGSRAAQVWSTSPLARVVLGPVRWSYRRGAFTGGVIYGPGGQAGR